MRITTIRRRAIAALLTAAGVIAASSSAQAGETSTCYGVQASATTAFDPAVGGFVGEADFRFNGDEVVVPAVTFVTGATSTAHTFQTPFGTIVTDDELVLVPIEPGLFSLRSRLSVVSGGTGKLQLLPASTLDLVNGVANWHARGHVCVDD